MYLQQTFNPACIVLSNISSDFIRKAPVFIAFGGFLDFASSISMPPPLPDIRVRGKVMLSHDVHPNSFSERPSFLLVRSQGEIYTPCLAFQWGPFTVLDSLLQIIFWRLLADPRAVRGSFFLCTSLESDLVFFRIPTLHRPTPGVSLAPVLNPFGALFVSSTLS